MARDHFHRTRLLGVPVPVSEAGNVSRVVNELRHPFPGLPEPIRWWPRRSPKFFLMKCCHQSTDRKHPDRRILDLIKPVALLTCLVHDDAMDIEGVDTPCYLIGVARQRPLALVPNRGSPHDSRKPDYAHYNSDSFPQSSSLKAHCIFPFTHEYPNG
jgi:hypothetical protein